MKLKIQETGGLRHLFRPVVINNYRGWQALCAPGLHHNNLPGMHCLLDDDAPTCLLCIVAATFTA